MPSLKINAFRRVYPDQCAPGAPSLSKPRASRRASRCAARRCRRGPLLFPGPGSRVTQEFLSHMLGVRRSSASIVAGTLQEAGFITYRRGHIRLLDVAQIEQGACKCYGAVKAHYRRLLTK